jgi:hypothetical protein
MAKRAWEPNYASINPDSLKHKALWIEAMDWARLEMDKNVLKDELVAWATTNQPDNAEVYKQLPAWSYMTVGRIALLINRGAVPSEQTVAWFNKNLAGLITATVEIVEDDSIDAVVDTAAVKKVTEYVNLYSFIEAILRKHQADGDAIESAITERLKKLSPARPMLQKLYNHFKDSASDAQLDATNPEVEKMIAPLVLAVNILANFSGNAKIVSKNTKKVGRKTEKAVAKVQYKAMDTDLNVASVSPAQIPGASSVAVYNTKSRKIMLYNAAKGSELTIENKRIVGFDEAASFAKTLRKPKETLGMLRDAGTARRLVVVLEDYIKGKRHVVNGKMGKDMIIVKVIK